MKDRISVYARIKPTERAAGCHNVDNNRIVFQKQQEERFMTTNARSVFDFTFDGVFDMSTKQEDVFETIAQPVIDAYVAALFLCHITVLCSALDGYNGTIFAYGQTGSGKTFTITGGDFNYKQRGIIPRTLDYIFSQFRKVFAVP